MKKLSLNVLGPPCLVSSRGPVALQRKPLALLIYLAVTSRAHGRDTLATLLWPRNGQRQARANLRKGLFTLSRILGAGVLDLERETVAIRPGPGWSLDLADFLLLGGGCAAHRPSPSPSCPSCLLVLERAAGLYRGDFLAGFTLRDSRQFDEWELLQGEEARLASARVMRCLQQGKEAAGRLEDALVYARRWAALDPLEEEAHRALMHLYAKAGQRPAALRQFEELERRLRDELGAEPDRQTTELLRLIREDALVPREAAAPGRPAWGDERRGDLRLVTVLAAGMSASTDDAWDEQPQEAARRVAPFLDAVDETLRRFETRREEGPVHEVIAVFGAAASHEDDAERAVRAAFSILDAARDGGLSVSVGIHTGLVSLESPVVIGAPLNRAARLRFLAGPGDVLVSGATVHHTHGAIEYRAHHRGGRNPSGRPGIFHAVAVRPRTEKSYGVQGMRAPMLGRDAELQSLRRAAADAARGQGTFVTIVGEAGIGKSRLLRELHARVDTEMRRDGPVWLEGRCLELGRSESYWPLREALGGWFRVTPADTAQSRGARLAEGLQDLADAQQLAAQDLEDAAPVLGALFRARFGNAWDERLLSIPPDQVRQRTLSALGILVGAITRARPLVLVLEDVHWSDPLSLDAVTLLMESVAGRRLLLVCTFRPESAHRSATLETAAQRRCPGRFTEIRLRELADRDSRRQVASMLGVQSLPADVEALLPDRIHGNPFFTEELVRSLVDSGSLSREGTSWRVRPGRPAAAVPSNVLAITQSRVDRLDHEARAVLQGASVVGSSFTAALARATVPASVNVQESVEALCRASLICEEGPLPVTSYAFTHSLVRESVYASLPLARRTRLHHDVARAIEALPSTDVDEMSPSLAFHYDRAGVREKAVEYLIRAGRRAARRYLNDEAKADFERALTLLAEGAEPGGLQARLACVQGLAAVHGILAEYRESERRWREAIEAAARSGASPLQLADLYFRLGLSLFMEDQLPQARAIAEKGLALLGSRPGGAAAANLMTLVARCSQFFDDTAFIAASMEAARIMEELPDLGQIAAREVSRVANTFIRLRMKGEGAKWHELARRIADRTQDPAMMAAYLHSVGFHALFYGDLDQALDLNTRALQLATRIGDRERISFELLYIAWCHEWRGDLDEELTCCRRCLDGMSFEDEIPLSRIKLADGSRNQATALFGLGRREEGLSHLTRAIELYRGFLEPGQIGSHRVTEIGLCAKALLALGMPAQAKDILLELFDRAPHRVAQDLVPIRLGMATALSGLEAALGDEEEFRAFCRRYRDKYPDCRESPFLAWHAEPSATGRFCQELLRESFSPCAPGWRWVDPFGDCSYRMGADGLTIRAANGRDLWHLNTGAPRLVRALEGDFAVQAVSRPFSQTVPALGGICIWQDEDHFFHLERGALGKEDLTFKGCVGSRSMILGRGRILSESVELRIERDGRALRAYCRAPGSGWLSLGAAEVDLCETLEAGVYASGWIDRSYYHGAFPNGAAIHYPLFQVLR